MSLTRCLSACELFPFGLLADASQGQWESKYMFVYREASLCIIIGMYVAGTTQYTPEEAIITF